MCDGDGRDLGVIGPSRGLASGVTQRRSDPAEGSRGRGVEGEGFEVGLGLLKVRLPGGCLLYTSDAADE